ncbi:GMC family oxidoreductase [Sphingobacterium sp. UT-1RO-CII-1]|uniref:GMC oxidoreductase n=1 Tax=Sphingobacterium sp. UT-1RO-CII-1 TaxID=2995225 RepID=UPI00227BC0C3|nr:GMC family oxidoreductase [Sphingobacterium sp. UT-1RO-CII-1]MCY4778639.1 GMC family oxidoreductase [Sphingobacterium sp. UT-1RO-CII-1]
MSEYQIKESPEVYDAIIVGSGAGGGMAGYIMAEAGLKVLMLEAGPFYDPAVDSLQLRWPWESPRRGASTTRPFGDFDAAYGGWQLEGEPYTKVAGTEFDWFRARMLGGRTNHWGRISLRMGPDDFKPTDGMTEEWPIGYEDVKPFYDRVDRMIGIYGTVEGIRNEPDGIFMKPPKPRLNELYIAKGAKKAGVPVIAGRGAVLTEASSEIKGRGVCFYCGQCGRACKVYGDFSSSSCLVIPAMKTGNLKLIDNAMVREVLTNDEGMATGVSYVDTKTLQEYSVRGKTVILGASACESARIMLNSKSAAHPGGVGNSSGLVGRYLHDSTGAGVGAVIPQLLDRKRYNEDGTGSVHIYSPWWEDNKKLNFPRGYHIEYSGGLGMPSYGSLNWVPSVNGHIGGQKERGGYGKELKEDYRKFYGANIYLSGRGTALARKDNYCEIDPSRVDKYGIPVLRFHYKWHNEEILQAKHMQETFQSIIHEMGAVVTSTIHGPDTMYGLEAPGKIIHEGGTTRMGNDPKSSVLNKWGQAHDCKNLYVVDAGPFVQQGDKNLTWTILALSMRTTEYILEEKKKLNS